MRSQFSIVGVRNGTQVEITPAANILKVFNLSKINESTGDSLSRPLNVPYVITLNEGEVYFAQGDRDLTGTRMTVRSDVSN